MIVFPSRSPNARRERRARGSGGAAGDGRDAAVAIELGEVLLAVIAHLRAGARGHEIARDCRPLASTVRAPRPGGTARVPPCSSGCAGPSWEETPGSPSRGGRPNAARTGADARAAIWSAGVRAREFTTNERGGRSSRSALARRAAGVWGDDSSFPVERFRPSILESTRSRASCFFPGLWGPRLEKRGGNDVTPARRGADPVARTTADPHPPKGPRARRVRERFCRLVRGRRGLREKLGGCQCLPPGRSSETCFERGSSRSRSRPPRGASASPHARTPLASPRTATRAAQTPPDTPARTRVDPRVRDEPPPPRPPWSPTKPTGTAARVANPPPPPPTRTTPHPFPHIPVPPFRGRRARENVRLARAQQRRVPPRVLRGSSRGPRARASSPRRRPVL